MREFFLIYIYMKKKIPNYCPQNNNNNNNNGALTIKTLLELGIRFCSAFIFSLILLLLLCIQTIKTAKSYRRDLPKKQKL